MPGNDLVLWETVQTFIGADDDDQKLVEFLITAASKFANQFTFRKLTRRDYTEETDDEVYDGIGSTVLYLRQYPVNTITAIYEDTERVWGSGTEIDSDSYTFYPNRGKVVFDNVLYVGARTVKVEYNAGYIPPDTPEDLAMAILITIDYWYKRISDHGWGVTSVGVESKRIVYQLGVPNQAKELLKPYRKAVLL